VVNQTSGANTSAIHLRLVALSYEKEDDVEAEEGYWYVRLSSLKLGPRTELGQLRKPL